MKIVDNENKLNSSLGLSKPTESLFGFFKEPTNARPQLLLTYKLPYSEELILARKEYKQGLESSMEEYFYASKRDNTEYFKIFNLCLNYAERKISLAKKLACFPHYKTGTKGVLLEEAAIALFPLVIQQAYKLNNDRFDTRLCVLNEIVVALPPSDYRILKK